MRIDYDIKLDFDDVLIKPKRSKMKSRADVSLFRDFVFLHSKLSFNGIPIMASNMDTTGLFSIANIFNNHKMITVLNKFYNINDYSANYNSSFFSDFVIPSIGTSDNELEKFIKIYNIVSHKPKFICIDVANGYGEYLIEFIKKVRSLFPKITIIAGNVVSAEMTEQLILSGCDIVKVGIGSGAACTTRLKTGVGCPQLSAIIECADAAHGLGGHVISDGGCKTPADIVKAFAAGADFVMLGGMIAGHDESGGDLIVEKYQTNKLDDNNNCIIEEKKYKLFYGMSSDTAQNKYYGEQKNYRASEGRTLKIIYKGKLDDTIREILGGIRSACTYVGASCLKNLSKCTTFIRVNNTHNKIYENYELKK